MAVEEGSESAAAAADWGNPEDYHQPSQPMDDSPFVQDKGDFEGLEAFYTVGENNEVFLSKLGEIKKDYSHLRRVRGDGNCFYRAYLFAMMERVIGDPAGAKAVKAILESYLQKLTGEGGLGYQRDAIEMFYDECIEPLDAMIAGTYSAEKLEATFRDYSSSNGIVFFSRLICSCYLQVEEEHFAPFLMGEGLSVKDYVQREVEPLDKEVEQLQIIALCQALNMPLRIVYLDRSDGPVNHHDFPEGSQPEAFMLYRPGHYDLLYRK